jgi:hypothetical protein
MSKDYEAILQACPFEFIDQPGNGFQDMDSSLGVHLNRPGRLNDYVVSGYFLGDWRSKAAACRAVYEKLVFEGFLKVAT